MSYSETLEAIVLKTYDVGEADRYCILFTKERGRVAVRARGVRKLTSRMGGSLIPFQHVSVSVRKTDAGSVAAGVTSVSSYHARSLGSYADAVQGFEVLMRLLQEEEALPPVFSASVAFLRACDEGVPHASLAYTFRLLHLLGFLPADDALLTYVPLTQVEREFVTLSRGGYFVRVSGLEDASRLERLRDRFLHDQLTSPLKAPGVLAAMNDLQR